jgi:predicted O-linked N-acetylglucosamine transferase (SPINDLY family)
MNNPAIRDLLVMADQYYRAGDYQRAANIYEQVLSSEPTNNEGLFMMGVIFSTMKQFDKAEKFIKAAASQNTALSFFQYKVLGDVLRSKGNTEEAIESYKRAISLKPDFVEGMGNLASMFLAAGRLDEAAHYNHKVLALNPDYVLGLYNMGAIYELQGKFDDALKYYERALSLKPDITLALSGMGRMLQRANKPDQALEYFKKSIKITPTAEAFAHMGEILQETSRSEEAEEYYKTALSMKPNNTEYLNNLGGIYSRAERYKDAYLCYKQVLDLEPNNPGTLNNMASSLKAFSQMDEAIECHKKALKIRPAHAPTYTNLLLAMVYSSSVTAQELYDTAKEFGATVADPMLKNYKFKNTVMPGRKLKIGYVSPDFRAHSVNYFFEPLLKDHNRNDFEIYGYSNVEKSDPVTVRLQNEFDVWRDISSLSDDEAADQIYKDQIDILVDLAGHTGRNRLLVFARKPAPVQATWLGYPATTGVKAIDYRIVDIYAEPEGLTEHLSVEKLWRMPEIFCCYGGHPKNPTVIDHPPFEDNRYITFGCFNNFAKVTDSVLALWSEILRQVPDARLLLEIAGVDQFRNELMLRFERLGLPVDRLIVEQKRPENQYVLYNRIDIALDPFPCNGGTTSMDTMWMGVPMITLAGNSFVSRMGVTILTNAGIPEFIAYTKEEYIKKAVDLASNREVLAKIREGMRARVEKSPLMDQPRFARNMEQAYKAMWQAWIDDKK